jgi:hypothetical protein
MAPASPCLYIYRTASLRSLRGAVLAAGRTKKKTCGNRTGLLKKNDLPLQLIHYFIIGIHRRVFAAFRSVAFMKLLARRTA